MKISDYRADYYFFTGKASEIVRQLSLAGIAVVWIFKSTDGTSFRLSTDLLIPSIAFLVSLGFDLAQYVVAATIWKKHYRSLEEQEIPAGTDREEHDFGPHDEKQERPIAVLFWIKIAIASTAWCWLTSVLIRRLIS